MESRWKEVSTMVWEEVLLNDEGDKTLLLWHDIDALAYWEDEED